MNKSGTVLYSTVLYHALIEVCTAGEVLIWRSVTRMKAKGSLFFFNFLHKTSKLLLCCVLYCIVVS